MKKLSEVEQEEQDRDDYNEMLHGDDNLKLDHIPNVKECRQILKQMSKEQYWPNVYRVNDHGNVDLLSIGYNGAKIVKSWV